MGRNSGGNQLGEEVSLLALVKSSGRKHGGHGQSAKAMDFTVFLGLSYASEFFSLGK